jgi:hypothetical protein
MSVTSLSSTSSPSSPSTHTTNRHNALDFDFDYDYDGKAYDSGPLVPTDILNSPSPTYSRASDSYQQQSALKECVTTEKPSRPAAPAPQNQIERVGARYASRTPMGLPINPAALGRVRHSNLVHRPTPSSGSSDHATDGYTSASSASSSTSYSTSSSNSYASPPPGSSPTKANRIGIEGSEKDGGRDSGVGDEELRPTTVLTPGCPLLKDGKLLVYSVGF